MGRLARICNDNDVVNLIGRIICKNRTVLHLYVEHETDHPDLIEPTKQSTVVEAFELCLVVGKGVSDSSVGKEVGEDSFDSDTDYEASSRDSENNAELSDYEGTNAEDEDLYTTYER